MAVVAKLYNAFFNNLAAGQYNLLSPNQKVALLSASYTPDVVAHKLWSDISSNEVVATGYTSGGKAVTVQPFAFDNTSGQFTARITDVTWTGLSGNLRYAAVYYDSGDQPLLGYLDWETVISRASADFTITFPTGLLQMKRTV